MHKAQHRLCWHPVFGHRYPWGRRFLTKAEKQKLREERQEKKLQWLEQYKDSLEKELAGVNERLAELKKE